MDHWLSMHTPLKEDLSIIPSFNNKGLTTAAACNSCSRRCNSLSSLSRHKILKHTKTHMMWDSPLYAVSLFYYHWLIKKLLWPMAGRIYYSKAGNPSRDREGKKAESGRRHVAAEGEKH